MKKIFLVFSIGSVSVIAQPIEYGYDSYGNRTQRKLYVCNNCPETERTMTPAEEKKQEEVSEKLGLTVFPNPAQDKIEVVTPPGLPEGEVTILLIDAGGKNLLTRKSNQAENEVDMTPYKAGVYFIKVLVGKESLFYKVIKL